jgi:hypothetical protein
MDFRKSIIDAELHTNQRSVFRIPKVPVSPKLVVANVGMYGVAHRPSIRAGVFELIKKITVLSSGRVVAQLREVGDYMGFEMLKKDNSIHKFYLLQKENTAGGFIANRGSGKITVQHDNTTEFTAAEANTPTYMINLHEVIGFFRQARFQKLILPTQMMDLSIEIEWNMPANGIPVRPTLVYDEYLGKDAPTSMKLLYPEVRYDAYAIPGSGGNAQEVKYRLNGFDNRYIGKVLIVNKGGSNYQIAGAGSTGVFNSSAQNAEHFDFYIDGKELFPYGGLTENMKSSQLTATFGNLNIPIMANLSITDGNFRGDVYNGTGGIVGSYGYNAFEYDDKVYKAFNVVYRRGAKAAAPLQQAFTQQYFAQGFKQVEFNKFGVTVADI